MPDSDIAQLLPGVRSFDWNPKKRESNFRDHKIDFEDVKGVFDGYHIIRRSDRHGEIRYQVLGYVDDREVAVAFTIRTGGVCWLISARRASRKERRELQRIREQPTAGEN